MPHLKKDLLAPVNILEEKDYNNVWRRSVNKELKKSYKRIFKLIDISIFLKVQVSNMFMNGDYYKKKLRITSKGKKTMDDDQIKNFIMYYERITKIC